MTLKIMFLLFVSDDATEKTLVDEEAFVSERVAALNVPLFRTGDAAIEEEVELDHFPMVKKIESSDIFFGLFTFICICV
jgi:hypothetical protein